MALKDWNKWIWSKKEEYYSWTDKKERYLKNVVAVANKDGWKVQIRKNDKDSLKDFKTKAQALKFAKAYMRKH